jgi:hypothetical protein
MKLENVSQIESNLTARNNAVPYALVVKDILSAQKSAPAALKDTALADCSLLLTAGTFNLDTNGDNVC